MNSQSTMPTVSRQRLSQRRYPERQAARAAVHRALKSGVLVKAGFCGGCGTGDDALEGHHTDYSRPLLVQWLCKRCHRKADKLMTGPTKTTKITMRIDHDTLRDFAAAAKAKGSTMSKLIRTLIANVIDESKR